jgi:uncharacterized protein YdaU (DUF1376 family)
MAKVDIWMPVYIGDYLRDTEELSDKEHGAYLLLLMHYWQKDGIIGCDIDRLSRVGRTDRETAGFILGSYFDLIDGNYKNKRAEIEMKNASNRRLAATENGKKGGRPLLNNPQETGGLATGNPEGNPQESSSSSSSSSPSSSPIPLPIPKEEASLPSEALALAELVFTLHHDNIDMGYKATEEKRKKWAADIEKLNRLDSRPWQDIEAAIRWIKTPGNFWAPNIISGSKLREKFPTIWGQMKRPNGQVPKVNQRSAFLEMEE